ncbi:MAG: putative quinol monooxygenase [Hormoscilla sp.]
MPYMNPQSQSLKKAFSWLLLVVALFSTGCEEDLKSQESPQRTTSAMSEMMEQMMEETQEVSVPLVLSARFRVKPSKRSLFLRLATATLEPTRKEPGNISYSFYEESSDPNSFIYFEEWQSYEALATHLAQPYTQALLSRFNEIVDGEPKIRIYDIRGVTYELIEPMENPMF